MNNKMDSGQDDLYLSAVGSVMNFLRFHRKNHTADPVSGLSGRRCAVLLFLNEEGPCSIGKIGRYFFINASSASELAASLEEAGYLRRERVLDDNRKVLVTLTPEGKAIAERANPSGKWLLREKMKTLKPGELKEIERVFSLLLSATDTKHETK